MRKDTRNLLLALVSAAFISSTLFVFLRLKSRVVEPPVSPLTATLRTFLSNSDQARIYPSDMHPAFGKTSAPLFVLSNSQTKSLVKALQILEEPPQTGVFPAATTCFCNGTHEFRFYKSNKEIASFYFKESWRLHSNNKLWQGDKAMSHSSRQLISSLLNLPLK